MEGFELWRNYTRKEIAAHLGYHSEEAIWRGVVTPKGRNLIILFVTYKKESWQPQYKDAVYGSRLFWEGPQRHGPDQRIVDAERHGEQIVLFYREQRYRYFVYFGRIRLRASNLMTDRPSQFVFDIEALVPEAEALSAILGEAKTAGRPAQIVERDRIAAFQGHFRNTDRLATRSERVGQGKFRKQVLKLWEGSCSVTSLEQPELLRASHIKPWRHSSNRDRVNGHNGLLLTPNLDLLFDIGFVTFRPKGGGIEISDELQQRHRGILNVHPEMKLRGVFKENRTFLEYHGDCVYEAWRRTL